MSVCFSCGVDFYHNTEIRMLFSVVCNHCVCEPCVKRLFTNRQKRCCPACGQNVKVEDFSEQNGESRQVESEMKVRRQICEIYCRGRSDFKDTPSYDDYLEEREDVVNKLADASSQEEATELWRAASLHREQNAEQIFSAQKTQTQEELRKIQAIIREEGSFCRRVNANWGDRMAPEVATHAFQNEYKTLLDEPARKAQDAYVVKELSPFAPQPLLGMHVAADLSQQKFGGGYDPDIAVKKARHFFFADLVAGANSFTHTTELSRALNKGGVKNQTN